LTADEARSLARKTLGAAAAGRDPVGESYLDEQGLWYGGLSPDVSPETFVFNIIEQNPYMQEALSSIAIMFTPKRIETIGDLLTHIPSFK
jgi:hypothetical protein